MTRLAPPRVVTAPEWVHHLRPRGVILDMSLPETGALRAGSLSAVPIMAVFFLQAFASGSIYARIPDIQQSLGIGEAVLGFALMGQTLGALAAFIFNAPLVERFGTKTLLMVTVPGLAIVLGLISVAPNTITLGIAFFGFGMMFATANVSMNVEADRVEAASTGRIMNRCHGLWALGFLSVSVLATAVRGAGISQQVHLLSPVPVVCVAAFIALHALRPATARRHSGGEKRRSFALPTLTTICLVGFGLSGVLIEVMTRNWSVIFMRDYFDVAEWIETLTLPAFLVAMTTGRMFADRWTAKHGPTRVSATLTIICMAGLALIVLPLPHYAALFGFALMGLGVCTSFPFMLSAAAQIGDRPAAENVAAVTMSITLINLDTPALIGIVSEAFGVRASFMLIAPFLLLSLGLSRHLATKPASTSGT